LKCELLTVQSLGRAAVVNGDNFVSCAAFTVA
jgi:hypothetical protein